MQRFLLLQVGKNRSTEESDRARYSGEVGFPDVLGMGAVTDIARKAVYELAGTRPSLLLCPLVTRGGVGGAVNYSEIHRGRNIHRPKIFY